VFAGKSIPSQQAVGISTQQTIKNTGKKGNYLNFLPFPQKLDVGSFKK